MKIQSFAFNPFQENTYVLYDESGECLIIDPGCHNSTEEQELCSFIENNELKPVKLLNTHCHIDHILGNAFVANKYDLGLEMHEKDVPTLKGSSQAANMYGFNLDNSIEPEKFLKEGEKIKFGNSELDILFVPGHAPGHIAFVAHKNKFVIGGDVLFQGSIGRTDLPGGDYDTLINSIKSKFLPLGDDYTVYSGHGPATNIAFERENNPFLK